MSDGNPELADAVRRAKEVWAAFTHLPLFYIFLQVRSNELNSLLEVAVFVGTRDHLSILKLFT